MLQAGSGCGCGHDTRVSACTNGATPNRNPACALRSGITPSCGPMYFVCAADATAPPQRTPTRAAVMSAARITRDTAPSFIVRSNLLRARCLFKIVFGEERSEAKSESGRASSGARPLPMKRAVGATASVFPFPLEPARDAEPARPRVSFIIPAHNEAQTIAYYTTRLQKGKLRGAIEIVKPDGSKTMRLSTVRNLSAVSARASWTRDGTTLAFQLDPDFVGLFDFGRRVVANVVGGSSPAFSPDGTKLAFEQDGDIFVAAAGKPKAAQVVKGGAAPVWSPDSRALAFVAQGGRVGVVNADGSGGRFVTGRYVDLLDVAWRR